MTVAIWTHVATYQATQARRANQIDPTLFAAYPQAKFSRATAQVGPLRH